MASSSGRTGSAELTISPPLPSSRQRDAVKGLDPKGFFIRHPPAAHLLDVFYTSDDLLFQTIHMGAAVVSAEDWKLTVDGLVRQPFSIDLSQLCAMPSRTVTSFHECYGSPLKPPTDAVWRIGNVTWTGVSLQKLLELAEPLAEASFVWSDGLDFGEFAGVITDRYQKDLPLEKAMKPEVLVAYKINGQALSRKRGGPVRLVVPGWFGTNSTKWLCRLSLQSGRATGPYTTTFYNEIDPNDPNGTTKRPVWKVEVNSIITRPVHGSQVHIGDVDVEGWAWACDGVSGVRVSSDDGATWTAAAVEERVDFSWQRFSIRLHLGEGSCRLIARAVSKAGEWQPMSGRRNHVHTVDIQMECAHHKTTA